jgi:hypothetical protein
VPSTISAKEVLEVLQSAGLAPPEWRSSLVPLPGGPDWAAASVVMVGPMLLFGLLSELR